jgi:hypothetical protein
MSEINLFPFLDVIFRNGSSNKRFSKSEDFNEIAILTNHAVSEGLIKNSNNRIVLTEKGMDVFKQLEAKYKNNNKEKWIEKDFKSQIIKLEKNFIFLPKQNELTF